MRTGPKPTPLAMRFASKFTHEPNTGCWLWHAAIDTGGYGRILSGDERGLIGAHQASWEIHTGPIAIGLFVCHRCDVKACVNPDHLFLGTASDNMRDCVEKGRHAAQVRPGYQKRGSETGMAKMTEGQVEEMRRLYEIGLFTDDELGLVFRVSPSAIRAAAKGRTWKHVPMPEAA